MAGGGRAPTLAQVERHGEEWLGLRAPQAKRCFPIWLVPIAEWKCTDFHADPGALPVYMGFKCGAKCIRLLET